MPEFSDYDFATKIMQQVDLHKFSFFHLASEYAGNIGDGSNRDSADGERQRLLALVDKF